MSAFLQWTKVSRSSSLQSCSCRRVGRGTSLCPKTPGSLSYDASALLPSDKAGKSKRAAWALGSVSMRVGLHLKVWQDMHSQDTQFLQFLLFVKVLFILCRVTKIPKISWVFFWELAPFRTNFSTPKALPSCFLYFVFFCHWMISVELSVKHLFSFYDFL